MKRQSSNGRRWKSTPQERVLTRSKAFPPNRSTRSPASAEHVHARAGPDIDADVFRRPEGDDVAAHGASHGPEYIDAARPP
jgi:hypothetical protein